MSRRNEYLEGKVYVGGLPNDARSEEVEDVFRRYGKIRKVWVARRPPGFAFVEYEDSRDAEDAVRALDGSRVCGAKVKVELSHGKARNGSSGGGSGGGRGGGRGGDRDRRSRSPRNREPRKSSPRRSRSRSPRKTSPRRSFSRSRSATPQ